MGSSQGRNGENIVRGGTPQTKIRDAHANVCGMVLVLSLMDGVSALAAEVVPPRTTQAGAPPAPHYETVVVAQPFVRGEPREDLAASASVITTDRTPRSAESLPLLLSELPGVSVTPLGGLGAVATASIRGSTPNQVMVYVDGVPLNTALGGGVDLALIPIEDIERIEVYRGMTPLSFGASSLGGVVSLTSELPRTTYATARVGSGSFGTYFAGGRAGWASPRVRLVGSLHHLGSTGDFTFPSDNGTLWDLSDDRMAERQNNQLRQTDGLARTAVRLPGRRELFATASLLVRRQGLPTRGIFDSHQASLGHQRTVGSIGYDGREDLGPGGRLRALGYLTWTEDALHDPLSEVSLTPTATRDRTTAAGLTAMASRTLAGWLKLSGLLDGRYERFVPFDRIEENAPTARPGTRLSGALGAESHALVSRASLDVIPSVRIELARDEILDRDLFGRYAEDARPADFHLVLPRLALAQRPCRLVTLRGNIGRYGRLPSMPERYGNTGFLEGNPDLVPENGWNGDLGAIVAWQSASGHADVWADGALFGALVDDLIQFQQTAQERMRARNIGNARIAGVELSLAGRYRWARLGGQVTYTDARDTSVVSSARARQLPLRPRLRAHVRPELRDLPLGGRASAGLYADVNITGGNYRDPANYVGLPARTLFGAGAHARWSDWRAIVSAQNLAGSHVNDMAGAPVPGRAFFLTLEWSPFTPPTL